jgi:hypothetical protein
MQKSLLEVYLGRVAAGDMTYLDRLCGQLTDRLCYLPVLQLDNDSAGARVEVGKIHRGEFSFVPLFTTENRFKQWAKDQKSAESLSLLGGDLCAALGADTGILIDPGSENTVELRPEVVSRIATEVLSTPPNETPDEIDHFKENGSTESDALGAEASELFNDIPPGFESQIDPLAEFTDELVDDPDLSDPTMVNGDTPDGPSAVDTAVIANTTADTQAFSEAMDLTPREKEEKRKRSLFNLFGFSKN